MDGKKSWVRDRNKNYIFAYLHVLYDKDRIEYALGLFIDAVTGNARDYGNGNGNVYFSHDLIDMHAVQYWVSKCCLESAAGRSL